MKSQEWQDRQALLIAIRRASAAQREAAIRPGERFTRYMRTNTLIIQALLAGASPRSIGHAFVEKSDLKVAVS